MSASVKGSSGSMGGGSSDPMSTWEGVLYSEVQYIMDNGHIGSPFPRWAEWLTDWRVVIITARKRSCGKAMILHLSVSHSVHRAGRDPPPPHRDPSYRDHLLPVYGKEQVVRIILECILVFVYEYSFRFTFTVILEGDVARHIGPLTVGYPPSDAVLRGRIARIVWFNTGPFRPRRCKFFFITQSWQLWPFFSILLQSSVHHGTLNKNWGAKKLDHLQI